MTLLDSTHETATVAISSNTSDASTQVTMVDQGTSPMAADLDNDVRWDGLLDDVTDSDADVLRQVLTEVTAHSLCKATDYKMGEPRCVAGADLQYVADQLSAGVELPSISVNTNVQHVAPSSAARAQFDIEVNDKDVFQRGHVSALVPCDPDYCRFLEAFCDSRANLLAHDAELPPSTFTGWGSCHEGVDDMEVDTSTVEMHVPAAPPHLPYPSAGLMLEDPNFGEFLDYIWTGNPSLKSE